MYDYKLLEAFTAVIDHQGFEKAANALHLTQSAVSQRVRQLEEAMGRILLVRTNPPAPTDSGKSLIAHFRRVQLMESEVEKTIRHRDNHGYTAISIGLNLDSLGTWFLDAVDSTVRRENILLRLHADDQDETHRMMKDGEVSACISTRSKPFQSCTCTYLGDMTYKMYGSEDIYVKYFKDGYSADTFREVPLIIFNDKDSLQQQMLTQIYGAMPEHYPYMYMPDFNKYIDAVRRGYGIGMMPVIQCQPMEDSGLLYDCLAPHTVSTPLYWHRWNIHSEAMDNLTKAVINKHMLV